MRICDGCCCNGANSNNGPTWTGGECVVNDGTEHDGADRGGAIEPLSLLSPRRISGR
jgi:hypothetical protein